MRFRALLAQLPKKAPDGDAAIQMVWEMVKAEAERMNEAWARVEALLAGLPEAVREAFLSGDKEKFDAAFAQLTPEQQEAVVAAFGAEAEAPRGDEGPGGEVREAGGAAEA